MPRSVRSSLAADIGRWRCNHGDLCVRQFIADRRPQCFDTLLHVGDAQRGGTGKLYFDERGAARTPCAKTQQAFESGGDCHVPALGTNARIDDVNALSARIDTVAQWTVAAGSPFGGNNFADVGAILLYFTAGGVGRPGVTVLQNGNGVPANDYYFSDASPLQRISVDSTQTSTGVNGSALFVNAGSVANYSGTGAEPLGCTWPSKPGASITGVVLFIEIDC